jgi:hypothetical protein
VRRRLEVRAVCCHHPEVRSACCCHAPVPAHATRCPPLRLPAMCRGLPTPASRRRGRPLPSSRLLLLSCPLLCSGRAPPRPPLLPPLRPPLLVPCAACCHCSQGPTPGASGRTSLPQRGLAGHLAKSKPELSQTCLIHIRAFWSFPAVWPTPLTVEANRSHGIVK